MSDDLSIEIGGRTITASMAEWERVAKIVNERRFADRQAWEQQQRDAGKVYEADLCSCGFGGGDITEEYFSLEEAIRYLSDTGDQSILEIRDPQGNVVTFDDLTTRRIST